MRVGLLNNLRAGRNDARVHRLLDFLSHHPAVAHVETTCAEAVPDALAELARAALCRATDGILAPDKLQVALDGETVTGGEFTLAMATTLGRLFAGIRPFWGQGPGNVRFTSVATGAHGLGRA